MVILNMGLFISISNSIVHVLVLVSLRYRICLLLRFQVSFRKATEYCETEQMVEYGHTM